MYRTIVTYSVFCQFWNVQSTERQFTEELTLPKLTGLSYRCANEISNRLNNLLIKAGKYGPLEFSFGATEEIQLYANTVQLDEVA